MPTKPQSKIAATDNQSNVAVEILSLPCRTCLTCINVHLQIYVPCGKGDSAFSDQIFGIFFREHGLVHHLHTYLMASIVSRPRQSYNICMSYRQSDYLQVIRLSILTFECGFTLRGGIASYHQVVRMMQLSHAFKRHLKRFSHKSYA